MVGLSENDSLECVRFDDGMEEVSVEDVSPGKGLFRENVVIQDPKSVKVNDRKKGKNKQKAKNRKKGVNQCQSFNSNH